VAGALPEHLPDPWTSASVGGARVLCAARGSGRARRPGFCAGLADVAHVVAGDPSDEELVLGRTGGGGGVGDVSAARWPTMGSTAGQTTVDGDVILGTGGVLGYARPVPAGRAVTAIGETHAKVPFLGRMRGAQGVARPRSTRGDTAATVRSPCRSGRERRARDPWRGFPPTPRRRNPRTPTERGPRRSRCDDRQGGRMQLLGLFLAAAFDLVGGPPDPDGPSPARRSLHLAYYVTRATGPCDCTVPTNRGSAILRSDGSSSTEPRPSGLRARGGRDHHGEQQAELRQRRARSAQPVTRRVESPTPVLRRARIGGGAPRTPPWPPSRSARREDRPWRRGRGMR
jgi:hypothetical protein